MTAHLTLEGKIALELQHDRGVLEALDGADARYVINNQPVGGAYVLGAQEVDAEHLQTGEQGRKGWSDA